MNATGIVKGLVRALFLTGMLTCAWTSAEAGLLSGSFVTGELYFGSDFSRNWFYPPTYPTTFNCGLNTGGRTVAVSDTGNEFCYILAGYLTVDFNDANPQLSVVFNTQPVGMIPATTIYLTDTAFEGLTLSKLTDSFPGGLSATVDGDRITLIWQGGEANNTPPCETSTCHSAAFNLTPAWVPEPSTWLLGASGFSAFALRRRTI